MATHLQNDLGSSINISDLDDVFRLLTACGFPKRRWYELGMRLGLLKDTLDDIEANYPKDVSRCLTECLDKWLRRADNVDSRGGATWNSLSDALKSINEVAVANKLQCHLILLTIFESHHDALSKSLSDPINVAWLLHKEERMITREVVNGVELASPSIPKQREVLLAAVKGAIQTEPNHLQRFATALSRLHTTSNLSLASAIEADIDKYFPPPEVGFTSNTDEPPPSIPPPIASLSVLSPVLPPPPAPSVLPPSQMPTASSDAEVTTDAFSKPAPPAKVHVPENYHNIFNSIRISYGRMFNEIRKIVEENPSSLKKIKKLLSFCSDRRQKVDSCTSICSILRLIQDECSLTDVGLLAYVVEDLKITEAEELIIKYKTELNEFCHSVKVDLCLEEQFDSSHHLQCELVIFELDWKPEEHMLQHIKDILSKVSKLLGIKRIKISTSISVICSFPLSLVGFVLKMIVENFHILIHHGLKKLTIGNVIIWRRQDVREKELREKKPDTIQDTEFISFVVLQKAEHGLNEAIESKEEEIVELKQELHAPRHLNEEDSMLVSAQSDAKLMKDVEEENLKSMSEELVVLRSHFSEYKKSNDRLADNLRKMEIEYLQSLSLSSHKNTVAIKMRHAMNFELDDLKFSLKAMDGPDYRPLVEIKKEIERLQEGLSVVGYQLITERKNKEMIVKKIKETREKINQKKCLRDIADLNDVITCLEEAGFPYDQWNRLGLVIGIIQTELDAIRAKHKDPKDCLRECLSLWLQQKYNTEKYSLPSMESLSNAARKIGLRAVSSGIIKALPSQAKETKILVVGPDILQSLKELHKTFANLVVKMRRHLEDHIKNQKIELINIARFVEEYLGIDDLTNAKSIDDLFNRIQGYYYFLNCPVIECIATRFLFNGEDNDLQGEIRDYSHKLESFKESTKLSDLLTAIHTALDSSSNNDTAVEVVLKFISQWESETIKVLESFLSDNFERSDIFNYIQIDRGCVCTTFQVPRSHFQYLIDVATPKLKAMCRMGVLQLVINDNVLINEKDAVSDESLIEAVQSDDTFEVEPLGADTNSSAMSLGKDEKIKESKGVTKESQLHRWIGDWCKDWI